MVWCLFGGMLQHYGCQTLHKQCLFEQRLFGVLFVLQAAIHSPSFQHHHPCHHCLNSLSNTYNHPASNPSPLVICGLERQCPSKRRTNPTHSCPSPFPEGYGWLILTAWWRNWGGRATRGDPWCERPTWCITNWNHNKCCGFIFTLPPLLVPSWHCCTWIDRINCQWSPLTTSYDRYPIDNT